MRSAISPICENAAIKTLSGLPSLLCNLVSVWLKVPSGFRPMVVLKPPPESMLFVAPTVLDGSPPALSESENVLHSEHSSIVRLSTTKPHSVQIKSPCAWSSTNVVCTLHCEQICENFFTSCCAGEGPDMTRFSRSVFSSFHLFLVALSSQKYYV